MQGGNKGSNKVRKVPIAILTLHGVAGMSTTDLSGVAEWLQVQRFLILTKPGSLNKCYRVKLY